ncbi:GNAT family N-acetyltransferase [Variovorax sp.]|uniref:GNAT family N-acetyltransferase n=1 Tax=Variovorax sp. TaxID=1871043 RepID=UPI003BABBB6D
MTSPIYSPLDRSAWTALVGPQAHLGHGNALARRYHPEVAPFAGLVEESPAAFEALRALLGPDDRVMVPTLAPVAGIDGLQARLLGQVHQMVALHPCSGRAAQLQATPLDASDVPDALALVARTRPGPFGPRTLEMGDYLGIRDQGPLVAMAGERMRFDGHAEISAVCVDDAWRGRGLAAGLVNLLRARIEARGETAFLHVLSDNANAIALYERLGFRHRRTLFLHQIALATV